MEKKIQSLMTDLKGYLSGLITEDMNVEQINEINAHINKCDEALDEYKKTDDELLSAKETIIKIVKNSGSSEVPQDSSEVSKAPRSLEEIANSIKNGGK